MTTMKFKARKSLSWQWPRSVSIFLVAQFLLNISYVKSQNCGLPSTINVNKEILGESTEKGTSILNVSSLYVDRVVKFEIPEYPEAEEYLDLCITDSFLIITLTKRIWNNDGSFVDEERLRKLSVETELLCGDGRTKKVSIFIPLKDENTQRPFFLKKNFQFESPPCLREPCPVNFEAPIVVVDKDRDQINADMIFYTHEDDFATVVALPDRRHNYIPWYGEGPASSSIRLGQQQGYELDLYIFLKKNERFKKGNNFTLHLFAENILLDPHKEKLRGVCEIHITFKDIPEVGLELEKPRFKSAFYYTKITSLPSEILKENFEMDLGYLKPVSKIRPSEIALMNSDHYRRKHIEQSYWVPITPKFVIDRWGTLYFRPDYAWPEDLQGSKNGVEEVSIMAFAFDYSQWPPKVKAAETKLYVMYRLSDKKRRNDDFNRTTVSSPPLPVTTEPTTTTFPGCPRPKSCGYKCLKEKLLVPDTSSSKQYFSCQRTSKISEDYEKIPMKCPPRLSFCYPAQVCTYETGCSIKSVDDCPRIDEDCNRLITQGAQETTMLRQANLDLCIEVSLKGTVDLSLCENQRFFSDSKYPYVYHECEPFRDTNIIQVCTKFCSDGKIFDHRSKSCQKEITIND